MWVCVGVCVLGPICALRPATLVTLLGEATEATYIVIIVIMKGRQQC